ncbi:MAG: hypothetical protein FWF80_02660 [Defluviitaleaceae bacterium]|nr:hypothetical protein [Defluviitaleaceae bacterium]
MIEEDSDTTYIEFQNSAITVPPVEIRAIEYFGLGIGNSRGRTANQLWLLAKDVDSVLRGKAFARYALKDEATGEAHPGDSGIFYVSLSKLSQEKSTMGELAAFLLGKKEYLQDESVKKISQIFKSGFEIFKHDKEVSHMFMSLAERYHLAGVIEGEARGEARGEANLASKVAEFIEKGVDVAEIAEFLKSVASKETQD